MALENQKIYKAFGQFVRSKRKQKGLVQTEVAEMLGITQPYYHCIEMGTRKLSLPMAIDVCNVLNVDINEFLVSLTKKKAKVIRPDELDLDEE